MIEIPLADIKEKIQTETGLSDEEIEQKIKEKLDQLAGLISKEGAAHIVANELGVALIKESEAKIRDLYPGMRNLTVHGRVTRKFELRTFEREGRQGKVASFLLGDETGQMRVTLWNDQTDIFPELIEGDIVTISNARVKENRGFKELHLDTDARLERNPEGITITEVKASAPRRERKLIKELEGGEENVELLATVVQAYDPRFFDVCPECGKRLVEQEGKQACPQHGVVEPQVNYVMNAFLDDGTGNIRTTFWKQQAQHLTGKSHEEFLQYQENPAAFEEVKNDLLGEIVKVVGRCKKNDQFDRMEFTANLVFKDVNPDEELRRLHAENDSSEKNLVEGQPAQKRAEHQDIVKESTEKTKEPGENANVEASGHGREDDGEQNPASPVATSEKSEREALAEDTTTQNLAKSNASSAEEPVVEEEIISLDDLEDLDEKL